MGTDVDSASAGRESECDRDTGTSDVSHPMGVMIEYERSFRAGQLIGLGRRRARVRVDDQLRLRLGERLVLTVSVPETSSEKTQAFFRLSSRVRRDRSDARYYDLLFATDDETLDRASELFTRFQARGIVEV